MNFILIGNIISEGKDLINFYLVKSIHLKMTEVFFLNKHDSPIFLCDFLKVIHNNYVSTI